jgi:CubicO group peptidase (beta-lactamase class C family)
MKRLGGVLAVLAVLGVVIILGLALYRPVSPKAQVLRAVLDRFHDNGTFDGVALVVDGDNVLVKHAYGLASREQHTANTTATKFRIASLTKLFVATQILQLHQQGKLQMTNSVAALVPGFSAP